MQINCIVFTFVSCSLYFRTVLTTVMTDDTVEIKGLILGEFTCYRMKLKIMLLLMSDKFIGKSRLELLKINFDKARVLMIKVLLVSYFTDI